MVANADGLLRVKVYTRLVAPSSATLAGETETATVGWSLSVIVPVATLLVALTVAPPVAAVTVAITVSLDSKTLSAVGSTVKVAEV